MSRRIPQLDLLRAAAILLVIGRHLELTRPDGVVGALALGWYRLGWIGVDLFFVLSGFLIGGLLINEVREHNSLDIKRFLVRRGLKIYPAYFVFLVYVTGLPVLRALLSGRSATAEVEEQLQVGWPHLLFLNNYVTTGTAQHLWSIGAEEHFYLLLPFVVGALALRHSSKLITIGLAGVLVFLVIRVVTVATDAPFAENMTATHLRLDALLFGVTLRATLEHYPEWFAGLRRWRLPLVITGIACWAPNLVVDPETTWTRTAGLTLTFLGSAAFLVAAYTTTASDLGRSRSFTEPLLRKVCWIGGFSYAIYLWHVTAIGGITKITDRTVDAWIGDGQVGWVVSVAIICVGVLAVGVVATMAVERPVLRIRDRVAPSRATSLPDAVDEPSLASSTAKADD